MKRTRKTASSKENPVVDSLGNAPQNVDNLQRLAKSGILLDFVRENKGTWDHEKWLELCDKISRSGYIPVDFDQVGLLLEQVKTDYFKENK